LLTGYLVIGAAFFRSIDDELAKASFTDIILFEFGTLATIGYGNISPTTDLSRMFCILYSIFGIPLILLTTANFGKFMTKGSYVYKVSTRFQPVARSKLSRDANMPLPVILLLFACTFYFGSKFIHHTGVRHSVDDIYFSFVSFTTVGFGDTLPVTDGVGRLCFTLLYLTWGIMLTTALFGVLNQYLRKVATSCRSSPTSLMFASPREVRSMLQDLDEIITTKNSKQGILPVQETTNFY
uniref:Ion_trans_2 domain-containing protein n=1 Tax=Heligmosomoides polygyrus TaxID=6339 RepID=A0A183GSG2_HELPZ